MNESIDISKILPIIMPLIVIQFILMIIALVLCYKADKTRGPKWVWVLIIIFGNMFGSIVFFIIGRKND